MLCAFNPMKDLDSTTVQLTRLKSARSCLHWAGERETAARERRLGEQSAFCVHPHVHKFDVLPEENPTI